MGKKVIYIAFISFFISICCTGITYAENLEITSELNTAQTKFETYDQELNTNLSDSGNNNQLTDQSPTFSNIHGYYVNSRVTNPYSMDPATLINQGVTDLFVLTLRDDPQSSLVPFLNRFTGTGIRIHAWVSGFKDFNGNFFYPEDNRELESLIINLITNIAADYNIDGVILDYVRYPGNAYLHPGAVDNVNSFCERIYNNIANINSQQIPGKPKIQLSAAVMPECSVNAYYYGQDYPTMSNYLDFIEPMVYKGNYHQDTSWIGRVVKYIAARTNGKPVVAALQTYRSDWDYTPLPAEELVLDIKTAIDNGSKGYTLFRYGMVNTEFPGNSIQPHIDISAPGDTVIIHGINGNPTVYQENIRVDKSITIKNGAGEIITINAQNTYLPTVTITSKGSGCTIQGFNISGASSSFGLYLDAVNNCQITGNTITGNFIGIYFQYSHTNTVTSNTIQGNGWLGIGVDNSSGNTINGGNIITGNMEGIFIVNNSNGNTITANNIYDNTDAGIIILNNSTGNNINFNTAISNNRILGVLLRDADNNTITGNNIHNNGWVGVALDNADGNNINGNAISGNLEGINITNYSTGNVISGNSINGNSNIGISVINGSNGNNITVNNFISNNGIIGVYLRDTNSNTISANTLQSNGWVGVCLDNAILNTINDSNNINGSQEGLYLANNSNNNSIEGNNIYNNYDTGIYMDCSQGNIITGNTTTDNGVIGILLRGANSNNITGNTLQNNSWTGIALDNSNSNIINGYNLLTGSQIGIYVTNNSTGNNINKNTLKENTWAGLVLDYAVNTTVYQNNFIDNPLQALAQNGSGNTFNQGYVGNYWSDWPSTERRSIWGSDGLYDQYPSLTPF